MSLKILSDDDNFFVQKMLTQVLVGEGRSVWTITKADASQMADLIRLNLSLPGI
jgi:murein L,D-transpeptidase YafK